MFKKAKMDAAAHIPDLLGITPVFKIRWIISLPCSDGTNQEYFYSTGTSNYHNFPDTFFPTSDQVPGHVVKYTPKSDWARTLLEGECVGRNLMFAFPLHHVCDVFAGIGWHAEQGSTSVFKKIKETFKDDIKFQNPLTIGKIVAMNVAYDLSYASIVVDDTSEFLPFILNTRKYQECNFPADVDEPGQTTYTFPLHASRWSWMKPLDLAGDKWGCIYYSTDCKPTSQCWFHYMPFLRRFSTWETLQQSACIGGPVWERPDMNPLRKFVFEHDYKGKFVKREHVLTACNTWHLHMLVRQLV